MKKSKILLLATVFFLPFTIFAHSITPEQAVQAAIIENLSEPTPDPDGRVQTLNKKGAMSPKIDPTSKSFIQHAAKPNTKVLEIGAGYGLACLEALKSGAKDYTANDMDPRHIKILAKNIKDAYPQGLSSLKLDISEFPKGPSAIVGQYDAILIARVLHFMTPEEADSTIKAIYASLKPGGKIYAVMLTPYVRGFSGFIPVFEQRLKNGEPYPGFVKELKAIADPKVVPESAMRNMDKHFLFFNVPFAKKLFEENGFVIEKCEEIPLAYPSKIWQLDGRENIGLIARKGSTGNNHNS